MSGCAIAALVVFGLLVVGGIGVVVLGTVVFHKAKHTLEQNVGGKLDIVPSDCPVLSNAKARDLFGSNAEASTIPLSGLVAPVFDNRVLADSDSCWVTNADKQRTIILYHREGGDAHARYQQEHDAAQPASQDRGNGLTVTSEGYFDKDVSGLGDEAFCTGMTFSGATGVLVRQGDRLLYVSIQLGPDEFDPSQLGTNSETGVITNEKQCDEAQKAARAILG
jgi:hypothetical protein